MEINKRTVANLLFAILFSLTVSIVMADEKKFTIDAGVNQTVNAGNLVQLSGSFEFSEHDKHGHKKKHKHKHREKRHNKRHDHKHDHRDNDDRDEIVISWSQTSGTTVELAESNTLAPSFTAPTGNVDEVLAFTLSVHDDDGEYIGSDEVEVLVLAPAIPVSSISGRITSVDGTVLPGVTVNVISDSNSQSVISDAAGMINLEINADSTAVLQLKAQGYADQVVPVKAPSANGSLFMDITMIARGAVQSFSAASSVSLTGTDGASVTVAANSFVDANGVLVTGNIDLTITSVDVSRPASLAAFPGEFSGILEGATTDSPIISMGTVEFEFTQNGNPVNLAPGMTADVLIPIYIASNQDGTAINIGDTIPLWSLNDDTGIWLQEGTGTVVASASSPTGLAMQATVSHFSWWNCDVSMDAAQAIVTVFGPEAGTVLVRARTTADIGWRPDTVSTVAIVATPTSPLYIPSNGETCFWAEIAYVSGATGTTPENCITAAPGSLNMVTLTAPGAGPVNIATTPAATAGILDRTANIGYANRVRLNATTYETAVSYSIISGTLPPGLSLNVVNVTSAEITGIPDTLGSYSVVVQGTDVDGNTDTITINYTVTDIITAPALQQPEIYIPYFGFSGLPVQFDLNVYNTGGPGNWSVDSLPSGITLDPVTGILTIDSQCHFWGATVTLTNTTGSSSTGLFIEDLDCIGE